MKLILTTLFLCAVEIATTGCVRDASAVSVSPQTYVSELHRGRGIACKRNGHIGPASYLVAEVGRTGVPRLDRDEAKLVQTIKHYVPSKTLRFTIADFELIVFNAEATPLCEPQGAPFFVLNGACNEYYLPAGDTMDSTFAAPSCIYPRRPWMRRDSGKTDPEFDWSRAVH